MVLLVYRFGAVLPVPFTNAASYGGLFNSASSMGGTLFGYMNILSGQALSQASLFALGVSPYITASIVIQLLCVAFPKLGELGKDEEGKQKINRITRYVTIALAVITALGYYLFLKQSGLLQGIATADKKSEWFAGIVIVTCFCAGAAIVMWMAEQINEKGIGNGISMILFANILASGQSLIAACVSLFQMDFWGWKVYTVVTLLFAIACVFFVVFVTNSERKLPVNYAKRAVGNKLVGAQKSILPIKLNMSGVMPIIFANAIVALPQTFQLIFSARIKEGTFWDKFFDFFAYDSWFYAVMFFILIILFAYFYIAISFNPVEVANQIQRQGGTIYGYRPGRATASFITKVLNRVTLMGAIFLSIIAVVPLVANIIVGLISPENAANGQLVSLAFGGSSLLIVVGVVLETARELEAQMAVRHMNGKGIFG